MSVADFYDRLAPFYHLVYADWEASIERQAAQLDELIRETWGEASREVLDAACGVGTQALGLARRGFRVTASDLSAGALERARAEAERRGLDIRFGPADLRNLSSAHAGPFDVVLACDNSVPHLLTDAEILGAFREMGRCLRPGGGVVVSVRDYDAEDRSGTKVVPYGMREEGGRRWLVFQVWASDGPCYDLAMYFVEDRGMAECTTHVLRTRYYAVPIPRLVELMREAGFAGVRRIDGRFFQPLVIGTKPGVLARR